MIDLTNHDAIWPGAGSGAGPVPEPLVELTEQLAQRLQAGERFDISVYTRMYPQWAGTIYELVPVIHQLVEAGRAVAREPRIPIPAGVARVKAAAAAAIH